MARQSSPDSGLDEKAAHVELKSPLDHLTDADKEIIDKQLHVPKTQISFFSLFRYANRKQAIIMIVSAFASIVGGAAMPLMTLLYGNFAGSFTSFAVDDVAISKFKHQINSFALYFVYLGIGSFVSIYVSVLGFSYTGDKITQKIREMYLQAIFRQNVAFFDFLGPGEITTRISADMNLVADGVSQKVGLTISGASMFVTAIIIGFSRSWRLALVMLSTTVAGTFAMGFNGRNMRVNQDKAVEEYALAGTLAEEVISSARDVAAFGTQKRLESKYNVFLEKASQFDYKAKMFLSIMIATLMGILNLQFALAFFAGNKFFHNGDIGVAQILTVLMSAMIAGMSIGHTLPHIGSFGQAVAAATKIFNTIERNSPINPETDDGKKPEDVIGNIEFKNVRHVYPSRPDVLVLEDFTLQVPAGKMIALVGPSGSGKSTIFGLLERFYLPLSGEVMLDGNEISSLNLKWLRSKISIVSQDPVLFSVTIYESIAHGLVGTKYEHAKEDVKTELIDNAAKIANAYDFISQLPHGFQTKVGERGSLLSGGQKQRIAIARAIVSDPKILLLDEATASLDTKSERAVQEALDRASEGRTTIVIAHRLSTIKDADNIVVMEKGRIVEQGTHTELLQLKGVYQSLVQAQELSSKLAAAPVLTKEDGMAPALPDEKLQLLRTTTTKSVTGQPKEAVKAKDFTTWQLIKFALSLNAKESNLMYLAFVFCFLGGCSPAIQAIFLGNSINAIRSPETTTGGHPMSFWNWMFFMLGISTLIFYAVQGVALARSSANLIARIRERAFSSILRQDIEFYDGDEVTSGSLAAFLSTEANRLAGLSGSTLGAIVSAASAVIAAIAVSCGFGWKLALVCTATMPILLGCGYYRFHALIRMEKHTKSTTDSAAFACEAASSMRTVASLALESHLLSQYHTKLNEQAIGTLKVSNVSAILYALSQSLTFFIFALAFWYGGQLILRAEYTVVSFFVCFAAILNGAQSAGAIFSFAPDMGEARSAANLLKIFLNRVPKIDSWATEGKTIDEKGLEGRIELRDVKFTYPSRPDYKVLRGVNLEAEPGQFVALVGASGSGKSTVMALLERFYDPSAGQVMVDGTALPDYNLQSYRSQLALVSQETILYTGTIRENIMADKGDVSEEAIVKASKDANIYEFIVSLPDGFNTLVGAKGALLSGGQRQRLAIARALLRDPKILLLDEATSSLDSTSERTVQQALDSAAKGRTTIAIAHRLSTIQHADVIYVFEAGRVVERGRHDELMARKGVYWGLARGQGITAAG